MESTRPGPTLIELFAGGGGMALGLEQAGFRSLLLNDVDRDSCATLRMNRPDWNVVHAPVSKLLAFTDYLGKVDAVTGGFPCQAFSYAGKGLGFDDVRGTLFHDFARCVDGARPMVFMAENVRGLINHDGGRTLETILGVMREVGYRVETRLMKAVEHGVPQKRERLIIVGIRDDLPEDVQPEWPEPSDERLTLRHALADVPQSSGQEYPPGKRAVMSMVPPGGCWRDLPEDVQREYMGGSYHLSGGKTGMARRLSWDEPSLTLTTAPAQKQTERCHPDEVRPLTTAEYARIQTFPDDWRFSGSQSSIYRQIGNAVPVELARRLGLMLAGLIARLNN